MNNHFIYNDEEYFFLGIAEDKHFKENVIIAKTSLYGNIVKIFVSDIRISRLSEISIKESNKKDEEN